MYEENLDKLYTVFADADLSANEKNTLEWLAGWSTETISNIVSAVSKLKESVQEKSRNGATSDQCGMPIMEGRGFDPVSQRWIYGAALKGTSEIFVYQEFRHVKVRKRSMGFFMGRMDSDGNKVFEGDVLKSIIDWQRIEICFGSHEAYDGSGRQETGFYGVSSGTLLSLSPGILDYMQDMQVVGNVYEHPELAQRGGEVESYDRIM